MGEGLIFQILTHPLPTLSKIVTDQKHILVQLSGVSLREHSTCSNKGVTKLGLCVYWSKSKLMHVGDSVGSFLTENNRFGLSARIMRGL